MNNSGWAVVVVVALVIVGIFGYWAIGGRDVAVDRDGGTRIESDVNIDREPARRSGNAEVNGDREPAQRSGGDVDVEIRERGSADGEDSRPAR